MNITNCKAITFLDVETTHLDPSKSAILQISIITDWTGGKTDTWSTKIRPRDLELEYASSEALDICNYSDKEWDDAPSFEDVAQTIVEKLMWGPIVAHNAQFDIKHLTSSFQRRGWYEAKRNENIAKGNKLFRFGYPVIDTCALAYLYLPTDRQNLNEVREFLDIDKSRAHDAVTDTEDCRTLFYHIINKTVEKAYND
jgi:DNA polymerase III epsilon subunit-like protein